MSMNYENAKMGIIGQNNFQKWNSIKSQLSCTTDEEFVTKLLEIAEQFLKRNLLTQNNLKTISVTAVKKRLLKTSSNKNKSKLTIVQSSDKKQLVSQNEGVEVNEKSIVDNFETLQSNNSFSNVTTISTAHISTDDTDTENKNFPEEVNLQVTENANQSTHEKDNLDKIKIKICQHCNTHHFEGNCPIEFPHYVITDALDRNEWIKKYKILHEKQCHNGNTGTNITNNEINKYSYSVTSLPSCVYLSEVQNEIGVFAKKDLERFTQFGPLIGKVVEEKDISEEIEMKYIWEAVEANGNVYYNTESTSTSNWMKYIKPAPKKEDKNITVLSRGGKLYFITVKFVGNGEELLYWQYSPSSAAKKRMGKTACGGCNIVFSHPLYYQIHCSIFHDVRYSLTIKKYHCKVCGAAVLGKENIMKHAAELHNGQGAYQCQFCKKFFLRLNYLEMHRTYGCSANPHRSVPLCDFCGKKFCQPQKLKVHIKRMHSDSFEVLKEFQCKDCMKLLGSRAALQRHLKEVHQKQTDGQCSKCGKKFQNKSNLKIHMLTHSGIKPFKCTIAKCRAAFTTKQCLQFHYKKVHNFTEDNMPEIQRSVDYTFQAYSGSSKTFKENDDSSQEINENPDDKDTESEDEDLVSQNPDDLPVKPERAIDEPDKDDSEKDDHVAVKEISPLRSMKVLTKGSKKWISEESSTVSKLSDIYSSDRLSKDPFPNVSLPDTDIYDRNKLTSINDFSKHDASNASLLVEAALNSVCNEPELDIDVSTTPNCPDTLVNNLYSLTQPDNLPHVTYDDTGCINDSRHITLISSPMTDHISVTDELKDELNDNDKMNITYSDFAQGDFSPANSPDEHRTNFVRNYINSLSPNPTYSDKNSAAPSPPRFDLGHGVNTDRLSCEDDAVSVQNLSVQNLSIHSKNVLHMDLPIYRTSYKVSQDFRKLKFENDMIDQDHLPGNHLNDVTKDLDSHNHSKYSEELSADLRHKFDIDLEIKLRNYENIENDGIRQKNHVYENSDMDFRTKAYDLIDSIENRNKQYDIESDFRSDRNFEPLIVNSSELQGLDMSARSFHNYTNFNRYHHLYPELDRIDLRLNYSPPHSTYTHADILRVSSLDLTSPGRHSVDLSLRNHSLHQIANTRLLTEHTLPSNTHRLLSDQNCLISTDLTSSRHLTTERIIPESGTRILTDHTTSRLLNDPLPSNHLINPDQNRLISEDPRIISEQSRLLDQSRLITETRLLTSATRSRSTSPVQGFSGYSLSQNPYHPTSLAPRTHASPTSTPYHYTYY